MKIRNKWYVSPTETAAGVLAPKIQTYLQGRTGKEFIGLAKLKADVPEVAAAPREVINAALQSLGLLVDESGDENA